MRAGRPARPRESVLEFSRPMQHINVHTPTAHYAVVYGRGVLRQTGALVSSLVEDTKYFLLSSPRIWKRWGRGLEGSFRKHGGATRILFDDREAAKTLERVETICRKLVQHGADRDAVLVALGGGVVGDVAGFAAACYLRGVRVVHVPTTLVAQVDSAIGGKTGVDLPEGKNLIGAFHHPHLVVADPMTLASLPERQFRAGIYEVIKYGVIADAKLFEFVERNLQRVVKREAAALDRVIPRCIEIKADVVGRDEHEQGLRRILNFGHTFGHALEAATRYRTLLHGEAVGWGMLCATEIARRLGMLDEDDAVRITRLVHRIGRLPALPRLSPGKLLTLMRADKKTREGKLHFVLPRRIGEVEVVADVPETLVREIAATLR